jgi:hypothetical protein
MAQSFLQLIQHALIGAGFAVEANGDSLTVSSDVGIDVYVGVGEQQLQVSALMFPAAKVADVAGLNDAILRTHQIVPLTSVGISQINGADYYVAFGALSTSSTPEQILEEINTLLENVPDLCEAFEDFLKPRN